MSALLYPVSRSDMSFPFLKAGVIIMSKKWLTMLLICGIILMALVACGSTGGTGRRANEAHLSLFQTSIAIKKGESVTLINDHFTPHILANGTWESGTAKPARELGAPEVKDLRIESRSAGMIGPFTTAGTFNFYCTLHGGMNLTVVVRE
jgi:plastocyanin